MIGAVLAGGSGRRMGGAKASAPLAGRPLVAYPAAALGELCDRVVVVCKPSTELPELAGVERWDEPEEPRHPVAGIAYALERAGEAVLVCAADMPFVTTVELWALQESLRDEGLAAVAVTGGRLQPVLGAYSPAALPVLRAAAPDEPLTRIVERLDPVRVEVSQDAARSIDTRDDLAEAERRLGAQ